MNGLATITAYLRTPEPPLNGVVTDTAVSDAESNLGRVATMSEVKMPVVCTDMVSLA